MEILKEFISEMMHLLIYLSEAKVVHCDLKPDNIMLELNPPDNPKAIKSLKLIDFGSAFSFENLGGLSMSTPEYLAPEILSFFNFKS